MGTQYKTSRDGVDPAAPNDTQSNLNRPPKMSKSSHSSEKDFKAIAPYQVSNDGPDAPSALAALEKELGNDNGRKGAALADRIRSSALFTVIFSGLALLSDGYIAVSCIFVRFDDCR